MSVTVQVHDGNGFATFGPADNVVSLIQQSENDMKAFFMASESQFFHVYVNDEVGELLVIKWDVRVPLLELLKRIGVLNPNLPGPHPKIEVTDDNPMHVYADNPELSAEVESWWAQNYQMGKQLGYPDCCVTAFCNQPPGVLDQSQPTPDDKLRYEMGCIDGVFTGFIPCVKHAHLLRDGVVSIFDLIRDRDPSFQPFPDSSTIEHSA